MKVTGVVASIGLLALPSLVHAQGTPKVHELKASPATVHRGFFDATLKPVLTIDSGDIVRLETATGNPRYFEKLGVPKEKIPAELYAVYEGAAMDLIVTQAVDGTKGVHAMIAKSIFRK